jgi:hypothetical protein
MSKFVDITKANLCAFSGSGTGTTVGTATDFTGYDVATYLMSGSCAGTATITWTATESATVAGSYTACAATSGSVAPTVITTSNDNELYILEVKVNPAMPWQKITGTAGGSGNIYLAVFGFGEGGNRDETGEANEDNTVAKW